MYSNAIYFLNNTLASLIDIALIIFLVLILFYFLCMDIFACVHIYILHVWLEPTEVGEGFPPATGVWATYQESHL